MSGHHSPTRPSHHIHDSETPLPGVRGAAPSYDYSANTMEHAPESAFERDEGEAFETDGRTSGQNAVSSEVPAIVPPSPGGSSSLQESGDMSLMIYRRWCRHWR
jgi:hypothetical protein